MKKGTFQIQCNENHVEPRHGWIDGAWGYCKNKTGWIATDLESGTAYNLFGYATRAALADAIERDSAKIATARMSTYYAGLVASFRSTLGSDRESEVSA